jgi:hypothetical protein
MVLIMTISRCFKREFTEAVALRMWEACWANYLTDYFHLFLCLAIICVYADDVIAQDLRADEMLLHFSSLAMYMDGQVIARKARGLLHQFTVPFRDCVRGADLESGIARTVPGSTVQDTIYLDTVITVSTNPVFIVG